MFANKRYPSLREKIEWYLIVANDCVILNKSGHFQKTYEYRGPDLDSVTEADLNAVIARINNTLRRIPGDWGIWADAHRITSMEYPKSQFPDTLSAMIDEERRIYFQRGSHFENRYYLTFCWLPPSDKVSWLKSQFITQKNVQKKESYEDHLKFFEIEVEKIYRLLKDCLYEIRPLTSAETLTYLHSCVSPKRHKVRFTHAYAVDEQVVDTSLTGGFEPALGDHELRTICLRQQMPDNSLPGLLDNLNKLNFEYRWTTRFVTKDKEAAKKYINELSRKWFRGRESAIDFFKRNFLNVPITRQNDDAVRKAQDGRVAALELESDYVSFGHYTFTITILDKDPKRIEKKVRSVEETINSLGFTTITESYNALEAWFGTLPGSGCNIRSPVVSSLNLVQLFPISAHWAGPEKNAHWGGPPLIYAQTPDRTPFRFDLHTNGEVGHTFMIGPTGKGKSALVILMAVQSRRYPNSQVVVFDSGGSTRAIAAGLGGDFYDMGNEESGIFSFQPYAHLDRANEIDWALEWTLLLLENEGIKATPEQKKELNIALESLRESPPELRTMTGLFGYVMDDELKAVIWNYTENGPYGKMFDAKKDSFKLNPFQVFEMATLMKTKKSIVEPTLQYIFHRLDEFFTGKKTLLMLDEAWKYLKSKSFVEKIEEWLRELRKRNVDVIFSSQSLSEISRTPIAPVIIESCMTKIFLPNPEAVEEKVKPLYESFGLNDTEISIVAGAIGQRQYYFKSGKGTRLMEFGLEHCPLALAYCGSSSDEDQTMAKEILSTYGRDNFNEHWLRYKNLPEYLKIYQELKSKKAI